MKSTKTVLAVAIAIAGIAYAGDLDPPKGKITPTIQTWEYKFVRLSAAAEVIPGSGVLHGFVMEGAGGTVHLWDGLPEKGTKIGEFTNSWSSKFIELDVQFTSGIYIQGSGATTVLYRSGGPSH